MVRIFFSYDGEIPCPSGTPTPYMYLSVENGTANDATVYRNKIKHVLRFQTEILDLFYSFFAFISFNVEIIISKFILFIKESNFESLSNLI
jgi:hypothetical protein